MSNQENEAPQVVDENTQQAGSESTKKIAGNIFSSLLVLKESNPKLFFGGIGALVLVFLIIMLAGGDSGSVSKSVIKELQAGQRYVLKSANAYDASSTVRLVSVPGTIAAYDDSEEADRNGACQHMAQGTPVTALEFADAYGKKNSYVKVRIEEGECKGNEGWALSIDVQ